MTTPDEKELVVEVKRFQSGQIRFDLVDEKGQPSTVFTISSDGRISNLKVSMR